MYKHTYTYIHLFKRDSQKNVGQRPTKRPILETQRTDPQQKDTKNRATHERHIKKRHIKERHIKE